MEWSREKTMKLIELLQGNANLWNPSLCQTRRDKQKRRNELRNIAENLEVYVSDVTRKIQHLRTQYNRELMREIRATFEKPEEPYVSSWYAFEYLHFLKHSARSYRVIETASSRSDTNEHNSHNPEQVQDSKQPVTPPTKLAKLENSNSYKSEDPPIKDDLSLFGEYVANELRSIKGEKDLLVAKKKILDAIFEVKMLNTGEEKNHYVITEARPETTVCTVYTSTNSIHNADSVHGSYT